MPTQYSVTVLNKSGVPRAYFLFAEPPQVTGGSKVFTNVWCAAPQVGSPDGNAKFQVEKNFYAVCGTSQSKVDIGCIVTTGDYKPANLCGGSGKPGDHFLMTAGDNGDAAYFQGPGKKDCDQQSAYYIECDKSFKYPNASNQYIGLGGKDSKTGSVVPIATIPAFPGSHNFITPITKFWVSWGTYTAGQIINVNTVGERELVDFSPGGDGANYFNATVTQSDDGGFNTIYN